MGTMATAKTRKRSPMSSEHKAALARGREEGRVVRKYLDGLEQNRPKRGRRRTPESIKRKLLTINNRLLEADSLTRLHLLQERANLEAESARIGAADEMTGLERAFIKVARSYGDRKGIGYKAWRAAGVSAPVLQKAGISRTTRGSVA